MSFIEVDFQIGQLANEVIYGGGGGLVAGLALELLVFGGLTGGAITITSAAGFGTAKLFWQRRSTIDQMSEQTTNELCDVAKYKLIYEATKLFEEIIEEQEKLNNFNQV